MCAPARGGVCRAAPTHRRGAPARPRLPGGRFGVGTNTNREEAPYRKVYLRLLPLSPAPEALPDHASHKTGDQRWV